MERSSKAIAMSLRQTLYLASKGALVNTYPNGEGTRPVLAPLTEEERRKHTRERKELLTEWRSVDLEGWRLWRTALVTAHHSTEEPEGWAGLIFEESGIRLADPCKYCRECRNRR